MLDLHVHLLGHQDRKATAENIRDFLEEARRKNIRQIGFADHDMYWEDLDFDLIRNVAASYPDLQVRVGLEVDYREEREKRIKEMIASYPFDYIIGSVHQLDGWFFDFPGEEEAHLQREADGLYKEYFASIEKAAQSGLFDTIGHFDLIKIFKIRPQTDVRILADSALKAIKENNAAIEINTNGRYKLVGEFYPELKLIHKIFEMGIPITMGSDAHEAAVVGRDIVEVSELLKTVGVREVQGFTLRRPEVFPLPY